MPASSLSSLLAERLRKLRERHGLTQLALAEILDMTLQAYQRFESGRRNARFDSVEKLAAPFGLNGRQLLADALRPTRLARRPPGPPHKPRKKKGPARRKAGMAIPSAVRWGTKGRKRTRKSG